MPIVLFRSRLRPGCEDRYAGHADKVMRLAEQMPGFRSIKDFPSEDGERLAVIEWASHEELAAWRDHPEHQAAQGMGRSDYYAEYTLQVCDIVRESRFS